MITYKNKARSGRNNICGEAVRRLRKAMPRTSQRKFADLLQLKGLDLDKNAVSRIECGLRFVTDIELKAIAEVFQVDVGELLQNMEQPAGEEPEEE